MRSGCGCDEIVRELSAPSAAIPPDQVAEHLRDCPSCAAWAGQVHSFDRLWRESAPPDPPAESWDRAWAQVKGRAEAERGWFASAPRVLSISSIAASRRPRGRIAALAAGLAAAAALAVTAANSLGLLGPANADQRGELAVGDPSVASPSSSSSHPRAVAVAVAKPVSLDLSEGEVGFIRLKKGDQSEIKIETREIDDENSGLLGTDMALLSHFEGISQ